MKRLLILSFSALVIPGAFAQEVTPITIVEGVILNPDSIPVENAYLVSYKTLRAFTTDEKGAFRIMLYADDSLKISHISYVPQVIKPSGQKEKRTIILQYAENMIGTVNLNDEASLQNMETNFELINQQMTEKHYFNYQHDFVKNVNIN